MWHTIHHIINFCQLESVSQCFMLHLVNVIRSSSQVDIKKVHTYFEHESQLVFFKSERLYDTSFQQINAGGVLFVEDIGMAKKTKGPSLLPA